MSTQTILVVGATGHQGGAVIKALLSLPHPNTPFHILALTRNPDTPRAKALIAAHPGAVELIQGDNADPKPIFASKPKGSIDGVFVVTTVGGKVPEEKQAIPLIDAAAEHGVKHIVFTSVDRGGDDASWTNPTEIQHFQAKHNVEIHLRDKAEKEGGKFTWTVLRPVAFLDNLSPGVFSSMFAAMWTAGLRPETKLQLISVKDIGIFAAMAFNEPARWSGRAVGLAGDELTLGELKDKFAKVTGKKLGQAWTIFGKAVLWGVKDVGTMFVWFEKVGYGVDIKARRKELPELQDLEAYLKESAWMKQ